MLSLVARPASTSLSLRSAVLCVRAVFVFLAAPACTPATHAGLGLFRVSGSPFLPDARPS